MISKAKGFDDAEKERVREEVWGTLTNQARIRNIKNPTAMIFCGPRRHEIDTVVRHGIPLERIVNVERNQGTMLHFTRLFSSQEKPKLLKYVGWLSDVAAKLVTQKRYIQVAHLDFCDPIETLKKHSPRIEVEKFITSGVMPKGLVTITVLNGRVAGYTEEQRFNILDHAINIRLPKPAKLVDYGKYRNVTTCSPMLWATYYIENEVRI